MAWAWEQYKEHGANPFNWTRQTRHHLKKREAANLTLDAPPETEEEEARMDASSW